MLKTIVVPLTGYESDAAALDTAYAAGRPFNAHIDCLHVRSDATQLAMRGSAYDLATAATAAEFFNALSEENDARSEAARLAFKDFCSRSGVPLADTPPGPAGVSVSWREMEGAALETTIAEARFYDLVVMGRPPSQSALAIAGTGAVLVGSGRPLLIAPERSPECVGSTIALAWKDTPEAARALTAANPFLSRASKIILLTAAEDYAGAKTESAERVAAQLRWNGFDVEPRSVVPGGRSLPDAILGTAGALGADLLVMGGYGHSRVREFVFGGFTRQVLTASPLPVFLFH